MDITKLKELPLLEFEAGKVLLEEGEPSHGIYFLESGTVEVLKSGTHITDVYTAGAVFGEMSFLMGEPVTATVKTVEACAFRYVDNPEDFLERYPEGCLHLAQVMALRLDSLNRYLVEIKQQFADRKDHLGMLDEVLKSLMNKHPRKIQTRGREQ